MTSPPEGKGPLDAPEEQRAKRAHQTTLLEMNISLQRPIGDVLKANERVQPGVKAIPTVRAKLKVLKKTAPARGAAATKAAEAKKAVEAKKSAEAEQAEATKARDAAAKASAKATRTKKKEAAEAEASKATATKEKEAAKAEASKAMATAAEQKRTAAKGAKAPSGTGAVANGMVPHKERRSKLAADPALAKEPSPSELGAAGGAKKDASADAVVRASSSEERELNEADAEIRRLNAEVEEAAKKNCQLISISSSYDYVETATPKECLQTATTCVIECATDILAALQYLSPREHIPHDAQSVFKAVSDVPVVVDRLWRSACRVGATMALSMVLAHYPEGLDLEEVTAGFPSETSEFDVVRPYVDRVLAVPDLESNQTSMTVPEDLAKAEQKPQDFPAARLFAAATSKELTTFPVAKYTPKFAVGEGGAEVTSEAGQSRPK
ncbi:hypothetical protein ACQ4PT_028833 [Festuca glaucescens]